MKNIKYSTGETGFFLNDKFLKEAHSNELVSDAPKYKVTGHRKVNAYNAKHKATERTANILDNSGNLLTGTSNKVEKKKAFLAKIKALKSA